MRNERQPLGICGWEGTDQDAFEILVGDGLAKGVQNRDLGVKTSPVSVKLIRGTASERRGIERVFSIRQRRIALGDTEAFKTGPNLGRRSLDVDPDGNGVDDVLDNECCGAPITEVPFITGWRLGVEGGGRLGLSGAEDDDRGSTDGTVDISLETRSSCRLLDSDLVGGPVGFIVFEHKLVNELRNGDGSRRHRG